jgi:preprotein translocase subunit SecD
VSEPVVAPYGTGEQIIIQLPGLRDITRAKNIIGKTAILELKLVEAGPAADQASLLTPYNGQVPPETRSRPGLDVGRSTRPMRSIWSARRPRSPGAICECEADPRRGQPARGGVHAQHEGVSKFSRVTAANVGRSLAIVLDNRVQSAPRIEGAIPSAEARITGRFTMPEATDLALVLRSGALPAA